MTRRKLTANSPRVRIRVTPELVATACRRDSGHCMVADAVLAAVPTARYISVDLATIRFTDLAAGRRYIYLTPQRAQMALLDFDQGKHPRPFTVELHGAHVVATGTGRKGRAELRQAKAAKYPVKVGGYAPGLGALHGTAFTPETERNHELKAARETAPPAGDRPHSSTTDGPDARTGRRREFGLRVMVR